MIIETCEVILVEMKNRGLAASQISTRISTYMLDIGINKNLYDIKIQTNVEAPVCMFLEVGLEM
jgi:hypothetical protein